MGVDSGEWLTESVRQIRPMFPAWMLDSSGFYYATLDPAVSLSDVSVFRQKLDAAPVARRENYEETHSVTWAKPAPDGNQTMIHASHQTGSEERRGKGG